MEEITFTITLKTDVSRIAKIIALIKEQVEIETLNLGQVTAEDQNKEFTGHNQYGERIYKEKEQI